MSGLKKYYRGEPIGEFPGATWNALVRGEERDRQAWPPNGRGPEGGDSGEPPSPVRVAVRNDSGGTVPTGGVLKLTGVVSEPANDIATVFDSLVFTGGTPAADERHVIIASEPIPDGAIGYGVIPAAAWAKLNITDAAHTFAKPKASTAELESDASTGFPVIWKESGTGSKWAVVSLQKPGGSSLTIGMVKVTIPGAAIDGVAMEITPGSEGDSVTKMMWDGNKLVADGDAIHGVNLSKTDIRASEDEPLAVVGYITNQLVIGEGEEAEEVASAFVVTGLYDLRMLPGLDDTVHQTPYHQASSVAFELDYEDCPEEE